MRNNLSYLIKNTSAVFVIKIIGMGLAFLLQVILGKLLGVEGFGQYTMFITTLNLLVLFTVVGIDNCLIRTIPRIDSEDKLKWRLLRNSIFTTVVLFIIILLLSTMFKDKISLLEKVEDKRVYLIVFLTLIMSSISKVIDGFFQGEKKTLVTTTFSILLSNMLKILLFLLFYFVFNIGILNAIISYSLSELILLVFRLIYLSFVKKNTKTTKDTIYTKKDYIKFLKYSIALFAISGTTVLVHSLDKIMINYYVDTASVGMYKVAESYLGLITVFVTPFVVFWPMISNLYKEKNIDELKRLLSFVNKIIALISIPVIVMMIIFSKELFLIFGKNFTKGNGILYILLIGTVFDALTGPMGAVLNMTDYAKFSLFNTTFVAILNIILNYIFIPIMGAKGAALATTISMIIINILNIIEVKVILKIFPYDRKNLYLILCGVFIFVFDSYLYNLIQVNMYIKIILFLIVNYVMFLLLFSLFAKPNYRDIYREFRLNQ